MGGNGFDVEMSDMDLLHQLFDRQNTHMTAIQSYISTNCSGDGAFSGVMGLLHGSYQSAHQAAIQGTGQGATVAQSCSSRIVSTKTDLLATDRKQYEIYAAHERSLGHNPAPYQAPPGGPALGPASTQATYSTDPGSDPYQISVPYQDRVDAVTGLRPMDGFENGDRAWGDYLDPKDYINRYINTQVERHFPLDAAAQRDRFESGYGHGQDAANYIRTHSGASAAGTTNPIPDEHGRLSQGPRAPGTAWSSELPGTLSDASGAIAAPIDLVNQTTALVGAGQHLGDMEDLDQQVHASADGPSNSSGITWADSGGSGF